MVHLGVVLDAYIVLKGVNIFPIKFNSLYDLCKLHRAGTLPMGIVEGTSGRNSLGSIPGSAKCSPTALKLRLRGLLLFDASRSL